MSREDAFDLDEALLDGMSLGLGWFGPLLRRRLLLMPFSWLGGLSQVGVWFLEGAWFVCVLFGLGSYCSLCSEECC